MTGPTRVARRFLALALLALLALVAASCGGSKGKTTTSALQPPPTSTTPTPTPTATSPLPTPTGPNPSTSGRPLKGVALKVRTTGGMTNLLPLLGGNLTNYVTGQVEGNALRIVSVVRPDVIWVGTSPKHRILVQLRLKGKAPPKLHAGQKVHIIGQLTRSPPDVGKAFGVNSGASRTLLEQQGAYVLVSLGDLRVG